MEAGKLQSTTTTALAFTLYSRPMYTRGTFIGRMRSFSTYEIFRDLTTLAKVAPGRDREDREHKRGSEVQCTTARRRHEDAPAPDPFHAVGHVHTVKWCDSVCTHTKYQGVLRAWGVVFRLFSGQRESSACILAFFSSHYAQHQGWHT